MLLCAAFCVGFGCCWLVGGFACAGVVGWWGGLMLRLVVVCYGDWFCCGWLCFLCLGLWCLLFTWLLFCVGV